jgi:hypothetical protein
MYLTYHAFKLKPSLANKASLFLNHEYAQPHPVATDDGLKEYFVQEILDTHHHRKGWQYLMQWVSYRLEHNHWLARSALNDCKALNVWLEEGKLGAATW